MRIARTDEIQWVRVLLLFLKYQEIQIDIYY